MSTIQKSHGWVVAILGCLGILLVTGCRPDFPECRKDEDCAKSEEGVRTSRLMCVNSTCQQCRQDSDCGDASMECNAGSCDKIIGYCTAVSECGANEKCEANRCKPECASDTDCTGGEVCDAGACVAPPECSADADCASGERCDGGSCVTNSAGKTSCSLETVFFTYDSSSLSSSTQSALDANASCIKQKGSTVRLAGHADERGTAEYNIALGEDRAQAVATYLKRLGIKGANISTISYGEESPSKMCAETDPDSCHRQNRRVEFELR